jgi:hypothetical protein
VLYRIYWPDYTKWYVDSSERLVDCYAGYDYLHSLGSNSNQGPTGGAPTAPGYSAGDGWYDYDTDNNNPARGTISVSAGGGGGGGGH